MQWPIASDYNDAIQSPASCFEDPDLRLGAVRLDRLGLPKASSGMFASVYDVSTPTGRWAVKCFLTEIDDQHLRYDAISKRLAAVKLPFTVSFQYITRGIRVRNEWYPTLKMEWVDGEPLNAFISKNMRSPNRLLELARSWLELATLMRQNGIAHGDLQHGNILVTPHGLKLIDYDGMYVPSLAGKKSHETGHRNYQHPERDGRTFNADLDTFSTWVIFTSILATYLDPSLWIRSNGGDECLLFRADDFRDPEQSNILALMERGRPEVAALGSHFRWILNYPLTSVPHLDANDVNIPTSTPSNSRTSSNSSNLPDWMVDTIRSYPDSVAEPVEKQTSWNAAEGPGWVLDHLIEPTLEPRNFGPGLFFAERSSVFLAMASNFSAFWLAWVKLAEPWMSATMAITATTLAVCFNIWRYRRHPAVVERQQTASDLGEARLRLNSLKSVVGQRRKDLERTRVDLNKQLERTRELSGRFDKELSTVENRQNSELKKIEGRGFALKIAERREISELDSLSAKQIGGKPAELSALDSKRVAALSEATKQFVSSAVALRLSQIKIDSIRISGIGPMLLARLKASGVVTANDVTFWKVSSVRGIGESRAAALVDWRAQIERRNSAGLTLPTQTRQQIDDDFARQRKQLEQEIQTEENRHKREKLRIEAAYRSKAADLESERRQTIEFHRNELAALRARQKSEYDTMAADVERTSLSLRERQEDLNSSLAALQKEISAQYFRVSHLEKALARFEGISASRFLLMLIGSS